MLGISLFTENAALNKTKNSVLSLSLHSNGNHMPFLGQHENANYGNKQINMF